MYRSIVLGTFIFLCNCPHHYLQKLFPLAQLQLYTIQQLPIHTSSQFLENTILLFVSDFDYYRYLIKWNIEYMSFVTGLFR